ncbi:MAG TPA: GntR family transcriptional regulator [Streptosporangiaceae bacterium]
MSSARTVLGGVTIQRQPAAEQAAAALREAILSGRILPGTPLREVAIAAELGVSRNTVREAARVLGSEGLIRYEMNRGATVADITRQDVDDIYAARLALELAGVDALVSGRDPAALARLAELTSQIEDAVARRDVAAATEADRLFHAALVAATGSARLRRFHAQLQQEQRLALSLAERSSRELGRSADDHRQLLDALSGGSDQARAALRAHLDSGAAELHRLRQLIDRRREGGPDDR